MVYFLIALLLLLSIIFPCLLVSKNKEERVEDNRKISFFETFNLTGLPLATFTINGHKVNFLLDTGSEVSYIDSNIVDIVGAAKIDNISGSVIGGVGNDTIETSFYKVPLSYRGEEYPFVCQSFDFEKAMAQSREATGISINGILGSNFFVEFKYRIDYKEFIAYSQQC